MTGDTVQHHAGGAVLGRQERRDHLQPLQGTRLALALAGLDGLLQRGGFRLEVEGLQALLDRVGAHGSGEVLAEPGLHLPIEHLVALEVLHLEGLEAVPDRVQPVELALCAVAQPLDLTLRTLAYLALDIGLGTLGLELTEIVLELLHPGLDVGVATALELLALDVDLALQRRQVAMARLVVDRGDHVCGEVNASEVLRRDVEQIPQSGRNALEVPDVGDR